MHQRLLSRQKGFVMSGSSPSLQDGTIYKVVLLGTYGLVAALVTFALTGAFLQQKPTSGALASCGVGVLYVTTIWWLVRQHYRQMAAYLLILFYLLLAASVVYGVDIPVGMLLFAGVIVLAGVLLTARHALLAGLLAGVMILGIQTTSQQFSYGEVLAICMLFALLAAASWFCCRQMERAVFVARQAENALMQQKVIIKKDVKRHTAQLRQVQLDEMQQMYRFAELGQLGVTMLHDLGNHLTTLSLEIDGLQGKQNAETTARAKEIIGYLEEIVDNTRARLHGDTQRQSFDMIQKVNEVINFLSYKAAQANVTINWQPPAHSWRYMGDPTCFSQIVAIIVSNAIDAYSKAPATSHTRMRVNRLEVAMHIKETHVAIVVSDWGKGISIAQRKYLFKPFHSTKETGMGIGLFIAQQTAHINFEGSITLNPKSDHTEFTIRLPVQKKRADS